MKQVQVMMVHVNKVKYFFEKVPPVLCHRKNKNKQETGLGVICSKRQ
jgi:hypothetical protein